MNGTPERKIEIFAPFGEAYELTKRILFQPFDLTKWLTIGFAAFLAGLADGTHTGFSFHFPSGGDWNFKSRSFSPDISAVNGQITHWVVPCVIGLFIILFLIIIPLFLWLGSRGRFMFIDCVVRNRGAIAEPWREFKRQGDSLFLFLLVAFGVSLCLLGLIALPILLSYLVTGDFPKIGAWWLIYFIAVFLLWIVLALVWAVAFWFIAPVMYLRRCNAITGLWEVLSLLKNAPLPFLLYALFVIVLVVAGMMVSCLVTCLTCCIAAIPYIGTVILLPLYTFYYAYTLLFLRQFGPEYDAWANVGPIEPPTAPPEVPPPLPA